MKNLSMKDLRNARCESAEFAYGKAPNQFFKATLDKFNLTGEIILPAEGEGRNVVYAAQKGLSVYAFDISAQAKNKALKLAEEKNVQIRYEVGEIKDLTLEEQSFEIIEPQEVSDELSEGDLHEGFGDVIRFIGRKTLDY